MPADTTLELLPGETTALGKTAPGETADPPSVYRDTPHRPPGHQQPDNQPPGLSTKIAGPEKPSRRQSIRWAMFALLPLALIGGAYWYVTGGRVMSTDDAYVNAETVGISTDVSGIVQQVDVRENQPVDKDQVLYRLDTNQFQIALDNARANLAQTALTIASMKQDYGRMLSDVAAQQAQVALDQATYDRNESLVGNAARFSDPLMTRLAIHSTLTRPNSSHLPASRLRSLPGSPAIPNLPVAQDPSAVPASQGGGRRGPTPA